MKQQFGLIQRPWGVFYLKNKTTGEQTSLKTRDRYEAERLLQAHNESESQPHFNLALARVYNAFISRPNASFTAVCAFFKQVRSKAVACP